MNIISPNTDYKTKSVRTKDFHAEMNDADFRFLKTLHRRLTDEPLHPGSPYYEPLH